MPAPDGGPVPAARVNLAGLRQGIATFKQQAPRSAGFGGVGYLMFSKGEWSYGRERTPFDLDTDWIVQVTDIQQGWICWRDGAIEHEVLVSFTTPLPPVTSLPPASDPKPDSDDAPGYQFQLGITVYCVEGSMKGEQLIFKSASVGGTSAIRKLIDDVGARIDECDVTGNPRQFPVVRFGTDSYMHKKRGKIWVPTIEIVGFSDNDPTSEVEWIDDEEEMTKAAPPPPPAKKRMQRLAGK